MQSDTIERRQGPRALRVVPFLLAATVSTALADGLHPDVFQTESHLSSLSFPDPIGQDCPAPKGALTLSNAIDEALCRNPATRLAWATARQQAAQLGAAESAWLPSVTANGADSRVAGDHLNTLNQATSATQTSRDAAVTLSWTLYDFGGRSGRIESARQLLNAATANLNAVSQATIAQVANAYYAAHASETALAAARTTETNAAKSLEIAKTLQSGGIQTLGDVLQAETAYQQTVIARVDAERAAADARGALVVALGLPAGQSVTLAPEAVPSDVPTLGARLPDLMAEASRQRPDLTVALAARDAAQADLTVAKSAGRPTITVGASRSYLNTPGVVRENYKTIGLNVSVPLFNGFGTTYGIRSAAASVKEREASLEQTRLNISLDVWNAYHDLNAAIEQLTHTAALVKAAEANEEVAVGRYQSGIATILDVVTAQSAAGTARQTRIGAEYTWQVARAKLALALGRLTSAEPLAQVGLR